ncbi:MAG: hypothetical protein RL328_1408 [Acidobacteriota bacterium]
MVDERKLRDYCLSTVHPLGKHKARLFRSVLALTRENAVVLREELLRRARSEDVLLEGADTYGTRYVLDFKMAHRSRRAEVRSVWIVLRGEEFPRLVTCYVR